jgi:hypothetical protein
LDVWQYTQKGAKLLEALLQTATPQKEYSSDLSPF